MKYFNACYSTQLQFRLHAVLDSHPLSPPSLFFGQMLDGDGGLRGGGGRREGGRLKVDDWGVGRNRREGGRLEVVDWEAVSYTHLTLPTTAEV